MADNYLEYHQQEYEAWKAKRAAQKRKRMRRYLEEYKRKLQSQKNTETPQP